MDLRPYRQNGARLADWLPWAGLVADGVVINKDGAFQRTLTFRGPDLDLSTLSELMGASARLDNAFKRFGSGWCLHVEARRSETNEYPISDWPDPLSWLIDQERAQDFAAAGGRFESAYYLTLSWLPPSETSGKFEAALFESGAYSASLGVDYKASLARFIEETQAFKALLDLVMNEARFLDGAETLTYLHSCISDRPHAIAVPQTPFHIDELVSDSGLVGGVAPKLGDLHLKILSVRAYVSETEPGLLDALNRLGVPYRWVTRVMPLDREEARAEIEKIRKRWFSKRKGILTLLREALYREEATLLDNDATAQAEDADLALLDVNGESRRRRLCDADYYNRRCKRGDRVRAHAPNSPDRRRHGVCHRARNHQRGGGLARLATGPALCRSQASDPLDAVACSFVAALSRVGGRALQQAPERPAAPDCSNRWSHAFPAQPSSWRCRPHFDRRPNRRR
ncbi:MAG: hypothetical protein NVV62_15455 [Terricaulis sp.]|nr:hypothetical protein [Terricaulis sp.]